MEEDTGRAIGDRVPFTLDSQHMARYIATLSPDEQEVLVVKLARNEARLRLQELMQAEENAATSAQASTAEVYYDRACALLLEIVGSPVTNKSIVRAFARHAQDMVNFLDKILVNGTVSDPDDWGRIHHIISEIEMLAEIYPTSYEIKGVTINTLEKQGIFSQSYLGLYQDLRVRIKEFPSGSINHPPTKHFIRELSSWPHLSHQNILPFYGICDSASDARVVRKLGLVSPWIETNLPEYLAAFPGAPRSSLVSDIAAGLKYLHELKLVHGDLRGPNIFVSSTDRAMIANFELSVSTQAVLTNTEGTFNHDAAHWTAPELFRMGNLEPRRTQSSDIWSFGCVCYEVFTGKIPFYQCNSIAELIVTFDRAKSGSISPLRLVTGQGSEVDDETWSMMEKCWERDPLRRVDANTLAQFFARATLSSPKPFYDIHDVAIRMLKHSRSNPELDYRHVYQLLRQVQEKLEITTTSDVAMGGMLK